MHPFYAKNFLICPRCGANFTNLDDHLYCEVCQFTIYPHPSPATSVFIVNDKNQIMLTKRKYEPQKGMWDSVGGFVMTDESIEEGAIREAKEETRLTVKIVNYVGTIPDEYLGTPTITIAYIAKVESGTAIASDDAQELKWFDIDQLPPDNKLAFKSVTTLLHQAIKIIKQY